MKILITIGGDVERFKELGAGGNRDLPRLPLSYPFYGYLKKQGIDVEVISLSIESWEGKSKPWLNTILGYLKLFLLVPYILKFDFIITFGFIGAVIAFILLPFSQNKKVLTVVYTNELSKLKNKGLELCGGLLYMTREQIEQACKELNLPSKHIFHLPIGVDTTYFNQENSNNPILPEILQLPLKEYVVVGGDQLRSETQIAEVIQGTELKLVRLTQSLKTQKFWENYNRTCAQKIDVFCKAHLSFNDVRYIYKGALCLLNLVDNSWQPAGWTVLTEGMACGIPVIMNEGLVTRELKQYSPSCPLIEVPQVVRREEIQEILKKLASQPSYAKELGVKGKEFMGKNLPIETAGIELVKILEKAKSFSSEPKL
jgi:glycosyltransferase involved in cell wall biosynthesis